MKRLFLIILFFSHFSAVGEIEFCTGSLTGVLESQASYAVMQSEGKISAEEQDLLTEDLEFTWRMSQRSCAGAKLLDLEPLFHILPEFAVERIVDSHLSPSTALYEELSIHLSVFIDEKQTELGAGEITTRTFQDEVYRKVDEVLEAISHGVER